MIESGSFPTGLADPSGRVRCGVDWKRSVDGWDVKNITSHALSLSCRSTFIRAVVIGCLWCEQTCLLFFYRVFVCCCYVRQRFCYYIFKLLLSVWDVCVCVHECVCLCAVKCV